MARPLRIAYPHAYYHVGCHGNNRREIYKDDEDRNLFLDKLRTSLEIYGVNLHAYVLMNNHFHLVVATPKANLSEFMRHFNIAYTAAYNRRHRRVGHLYQGRYKAILIEKDNYLLELSRYLHLNPVRIASQKSQSAHEKLRTLDKYRWSSLAGYLASAQKQRWMSYDEVLEQVDGSRRKYRQFLVDGIEKGYRTPWKDLKGQVVLGNEEFLGKLKKEVTKMGSRREQPGLRAFEAMDAEDVVNRVSRHLGISVDELTKKRTPYRDYRALVMEMMYRYSRISQEEIGKRFGHLDYSAVSRERKRLRERMPLDRKLRVLVQGVDELLKSKIKI